MLHIEILEAVDKKSKVDVDGHRGLVRAYNKSNKTLIIDLYTGETIEKPTSGLMLLSGVVRRLIA